MPIDPAPTLPPPDVTPLSKLPNFNAREVPVLGIDSHLPPVPLHALRADAIRARFRSPPVWEPELRAEPRFTDRQLAAAAVLVPIVQREQPMLLLTQRTANLSTHSGQVAFPGGRQDPTDLDLAHTATREAQEEVGLEPRFVEVVGSLPTYTTGTRFVVTPVIALVQPDFTLALNPHEVDDAFEVPLSFVMDPSQHRRHQVDAGGATREWFSMVYADAARERFIWGATAGMLRNLYRFLVA